jgi:hypothetical protein
MSRWTGGCDEVMSGSWVAASCWMSVLPAIALGGGAPAVRLSRSGGPKACATAEFRQFDFWLGDGT